MSFDGVNRQAVDGAHTLVWNDLDRYEYECNDEPLNARTLLEDNRAAAKAVSGVTRPRGCTIMRRELVCGETDTKGSDFMVIADADAPARSSVSVFGKVLGVR